MVRKPYCEGCTYTLRAAYSVTSWTPHALLPRTPVRLRSRARLCVKFAQHAARVTLGQNLAKADEQGWRNFFCEEYVASPGWPVPRLGPSAPAAPLPGTSGRVHCPASAPTLQIFAYSNRPGPWLCAFLRTAAFAGAPISVIGWDPTGFLRPDKVWYTIDLIFTWLRYLTVCRAALHPNATLLLADTDQLFVAAYDQLHYKLDGLLRRTSAGVVFAAEMSCAPRKLNNASWWHARGERPADDFGDNLAGYWRAGRPFCLNSGNIAGRPAAIVALLNMTCRACRQGWTPHQVFEHFSRTYSEGLMGWIYPAQRALMKLYLAGPSAQTGLTLDYGNEAFHSNDGVLARVKGFDFIDKKADGSVYSKLTRTTPALLHYNGPSRENYVGQFSPGARLAKLQGTFIKRSGLRSNKEADAAVERFVRKSVVFLGPDFVRREVGLAAACSGGGRLSKRLHRKYNPAR